METKHTPGPWHVGMRPGPMIYGPNGEQVADMRRPAMVDDDEHAANARLIAAAPDGYALAVAVSHHFQDTDSPLGAMARAILAKVAP